MLSCLRKLIMVTIKVYIVSEVILHQIHLVLFFQRKLSQKCCKFKQHHEFFLVPMGTSERVPRGQFVMLLQVFGPAVIQKDIWEKGKYSGKMSRKN